MFKSQDKGKKYIQWLGLGEKKGFPDLVEGLQSAGHTPHTSTLRDTSTLVRVGAQSRVVHHLPTIMSTQNL